MRQAGRGGISSNTRLIVMKLLPSSPVKHTIDFQDVAVAIGPGEFIASSIKAKDKYFWRRRRAVYCHYRWWRSVIHQIRRDLGDRMVVMMEFIAVGTLWDEKCKSIALFST
jgi:hypothetical protein